MVAAEQQTPVSRDFISVDPSTGEVVAQYDSHPSERVRNDLERTHQSHLEWAAASVSDRADVLRRIAEQLEHDRAALALLAVQEMGKTITEARAEIDKCAWTLRYVADHGPAHLADVPVPSNASRSFVGFRPLGVVLAIMPWNFPYWQVVRFAAGALLAGNTVLLKHAENVTGCGLALADSVRRAGGPENLLTTSLMSIPAVHEHIADPRVTAVTLTGSVRAGREVASSAGRALKKSVLELGGSDAFVVLADADLERAAAVAVTSRFQNAGQTCIAAKRFIVESAVIGDFTSLFIAGAEKLTIGDPSSTDTAMGPLARADLRAAVHAQMNASVGEGAQLRTGGHIPDGPGWFYPPTVLSGVQPGMTVAREEVFGPVACVIEAADAEDAMDKANDSTFGLGGNIWTQDVQRGLQLAKQLQSGSVFINGMTASDARLPFGGIKESGYGRELSSFGVREFTNIHTTWVGPAINDSSPAPSE